MIDWLFVCCFLMNANLLSFCFIVCEVLFLLKSCWVLKIACNCASNKYAHSQCLLISINCTIEKDFSSS